MWHRDLGHVRCPMRTDYVDAIRELLPYIPAEAFAVILGQVLAGSDLTPADQEVVDKVHERAAVARVRELRAIVSASTRA